jgi:hypothetical protein
MPRFPGANGVGPRGNGTGNFPGGGAPGTGGGMPGGNDGMPGGNGGGMNGLLNGSTPSAELTALLAQGGDAYTWVAATIGANNAAGYQLATGEPVMAIGGFNGTDPSPTLAQFQEYAAQGKVHYFIAGGGGVGGRGMRGGAQDASTSDAISQWVASNFASQTVDGVTLYDLTTGA